MSSPILFGPNNNSTSLQNSLIMANGQQITSDGIKNYIKYNNFENNATTGYSTGSLSLTSTQLPTGAPSFGTASALQIGIQSVGQLAGNYSLYLASAGVLVAGDFVATDALTIDKEDQGNVLAFRIPYYVYPSAQVMNFSGTSSNTFGVAIYDVTNSAWIIPAGVFNFVNYSGASVAGPSGACEGTFQVPPNTTQLRLVIYNPNGTSTGVGGAKIIIDDLFLGPQVMVSGPAMSDWQSYTPTFTGFGSTGTTYAKYRRVGDSLEVFGYTAYGVGTSVAQSITLPSGLSIDYTKISSSSTGEVIGQIWRVNSSVTWPSASAGPFVLFADGSTTGSVFVGVTGGSQPAIAKLSTSFASNGDGVQFSFKVPISGWSSNTVMSNDTDTRVVSAILSNSSTPTSGATISSGWTVNTDTHGAFNTSTGTYTAPVTGIYDINFIVPSFGAGSSSYSSCHIVANAVTYSGPTMGTNATIGWTGAAYATAYLLAGQTITFNFTAQSSPTLTGFGANVSITRRSGPAVVAATESVNAQYTFVATATGIPNNAQTTISNTYATWSKVKDTHNEFNTTTGVYTIPVSGTYSVSLNGAFVANGTGWRTVVVVQGGSASSSYYSQILGSATVAQNVPVTANFNCLAGDTITFQAYQNSGSPLALTSTASQNYISISRVGN